MARVMNLKALQEEDIDILYLQIRRKK